MADMDILKQALLGKQQRAQQQREAIEAELAQRKQQQSPLESIDLSPTAGVIEDIYGGSGKLTQGFKDIAAHGERKQAEIDKLERQLLTSVPKEGMSVSDAFKMEALLQKKTAASAAKAATGKPGTGKPLSATSILKVNEGALIPNLLSDVRETIGANSKLFGPVMGRIGQANVYDTKAQNVGAQMKASSQAFGRYMEGGVLRKEDEEKYRKMFPQLSDTPEVAKGKLDVVDRLLQTKLNSDVSALKDSGFDVSGIKLPGSKPASPTLTKKAVPKPKPAAAKKGLFKRADELKKAAVPSDDDINSMSAEQLKAYLGQ